MPLGIQQVRLYCSFYTARIALLLFCFCGICRWTHKPVCCLFCVLFAGVPCLILHCSKTTDKKLFHLCDNQVTRNLRAVQNRRFVIVPFSATTLGGTHWILGLQPGRSRDRPGRQR